MKVSQNKNSNISKNLFSSLNENSKLNSILVIVFAVILFLAPIFPDIKLTRPKLLLLETGLYSLLFLWLIVSFYNYKICIRNSIVLLPLLVYSSLTILFYIFSSDRPVALNELKRSLLSLTAFIITSNLITSDKKRNLILISWLTASFLIIFYGILQHSGGVGRIEVPYMERVMSTFGNPIFFAAHIVITLPIAIGAFFYSKKSYLKFLLIIFIFCAITALFFTKTRAAYIGFTISLITFIWLNIKQKKVRLSILLFLAVLFGSFLIFTKNIWTRHQAHPLIWRDTLVMWSHYPLFGTGPGTFHIYFPKFASKQLQEIWPQGKFIVNDAHNEYVQYLSETGIIGFGIFIWLLVSFFFHSMKTFKNSTGNERFLISGLFASASGILVQNIFSVDMRFIISAVYLFIVIGLIDSFNNNYIKKENISPLLRFCGLSLVAVLAFFTFPKILQPYIAQKAISSKPDFFDEKILEPAKTIQDLQKLADKYPNQALVYEKLGWVYAKQKNWQKAVENLSKAHNLNPNTAGPMNNLGNIYFLLGKKTKAIECWNKSLHIQPNQIDSRLNLATAYYYNGQLKEAVDQIKLVLKQDPNNQKAIVMLKQMTE